MTIDFYSNLLLLSSIIMLLIEKIIMKEKYMLFSPYTLAQFSFLYIYIIPFSLYDNFEYENFTQKLSVSEITASINYFVVFFYLFSIFSIRSFYKIRNTVKCKSQLSFKLNNSFIFGSILFLFSIILIGELTLVNFSVTNMFLKMINPRQFTYLREGLGPITVIVNFSKSLLLFLSIVYRNQKKTSFTLIILLLAILFTFLGGSKSSLLVVLIYYVLAMQKYSINYIKISLRKLMFYVVILLLLVLISFKLMSIDKSESTLNSTISSVIGYSQEAYYSSKVITDFEWKVDHIETVVEDLFLTPIPRKIFKSKSFYGLYKTYWQPLYQPNVVVYHTSTYGFLAEGHMLFSFLTPLIYALLFNALLLKMYKTLYTTRNILTFYFILVLSTMIYFLFRTGLFLAATNMTLFVYYIGAKVFFKLGSMNVVK